MSDLLNSASLVMIPSGYKEDVVYSQIPTDGSGDLSFTRASNGTRINSAGLVEVVPWNLFGNSEDGTSGKWGNPFNISSVTLNSTTAPNGTNTGNLVVENSANSNHWFEQSFSAINGTPYTISVYFKAKERTQCALYAFTDNFVFAGQNVIFNLSTGAIVSQSGTQTNSIENVGNGWYRCAMTVTANASATAYFGYGLANGGSTSYQGDGTSGLYMWGRQLNTGTLKPYFRTTDRLNVPRLTYQNGGGGCPSLLLEKQSTNLIAYSNADGNMSFNGTLALNATTSPEGVSNGFSFLVNANANGGLSLITLTTSAQSYTFSVYLKGSVNGQKVRLFSDLNGTIETFTLTTDWVRYTKTFTGAVGAQSIYLLNGAYISPSENNLYYGYGMQLEASSYATSLIPTSGSSATRVADACYKTGISSLIGQTEGTMFVDWNFENKPDSNGSIPMVLSGVLGEAYIFVTAGGTLLGEVYNLGLQASISGGVGGIGRKKIALAYKQNDFALYMNGTQIGTDTSGTVSAMSTLYVGSYYVSSYAANSGINEAILFPTRLTNAELASLTTL